MVAPAGVGLPDGNHRDTVGPMATEQPEATTALHAPRAKTGTKWEQPELIPWEAVRTTNTGNHNLDGTHQQE